MPTVCTTIKVLKDGQYILATGTYKPRVRCYDTYQLSLKFERCLDSEVVTFEILSDDYSKWRVECWNPRIQNRVGLLDCALSSVTADSEINSLPTISALKFNSTLTMAVGTSTGQVLIYDLRSDKPLLVKDHQYGLPIKSVRFQDSLDLILSSDSRIIKMWNKNSTP
ncbi:nucleolar protein 10-like isoform X2 [Tamandua tetradactyla]|uniref:nucleolar protein 10-like isoform X2 n=1 Tax=Tamandua tetradactyla TaxID=48850 RepID=UPI004053C1E8